MIQCWCRGPRVAGSAGVSCAAVDPTLSREGKLEVLRELCLEHKEQEFIHTALKAKDKFGQTPMLRCAVVGCSKVW